MPALASPTFFKFPRSSQALADEVVDGPLPETPIALSHVRVTLGSVAAARVVKLEWP